VRRLAIVALVWLGAGCTSLAPSDFDAEAPQIAAPWSGPVEVSGVHQATPRSRLHANGMTFDLDLDAFSEDLARLLREALREAGVSTRGGGKAIGLQVVYLDFLFGGLCLVDVTVTLGAQQRFGLQSAGEAISFVSACRKALEDAVVGVVNDARTRRYLEGG
jgi:hypothetical protein